MDHHHLALRAEKWLRRSRRCSVVIVDPQGTGLPEVPDVIGWQGFHESFLIECKASRGDFLRDRKKFSRGPAMSMCALGSHRYYVAPAGMIRPEELPLFWGLLAVHPTTVRTVVKAKRWKVDNGAMAHRMWAERSLLIHELRRYQYCYQYINQMTPEQVVSVLQQNTQLPLEIDRSVYAS